MLCAQRISQLTGNPAIFMMKGIVPSKMLDMTFLYLSLWEDADNQEEWSPIGKSHLPAVPETTGRGKHLSVCSLFLWVMGHAHAPLIESEKEKHLG